MRAIALTALALLAGCALPHGKPLTVYHTAPQARPYVELGIVRASPWRYGAIGAWARDTAIQRLDEKARSMGADAVIDVRVQGGCPAVGWLLLSMGAPNCWATAEGIAVRWQDPPDARRTRGVGGASAAGAGSTGEVRIGSTGAS